MTTEAIHLVCRLQWGRLRAWKKRSLQAGVSVDGRIRPQAYSSSNSNFRGLMDDWKRSVDQPAVLWIVTSYRVPGRSRPVPSLAAKIHVRNVYRGDDENLGKPWIDYAWDWENRQPLKRPELCRIVEADPGQSRFYPANDIGPCLSRLRYRKKGGKETTYSPYGPLRVTPANVSALEEYARNIGARTVFVSYKHCDFKKDAKGRRPPWGVKTLARVLIDKGLGVWLDELCAPRGVQASSKELNRKEVGLLLAEGHAQSGVVVALETDNFLKPGKDGNNWTLGEYDGTVSSNMRKRSLSRFALHEGNETGIKPKPKDHADWSSDFSTVIVPRIAGLLG